MCHHLSEYMFHMLQELIPFQCVKGSKAEFSQAHKTMVLKVPSTKKENSVEVYNLSSLSCCKFRSRERGMIKQSLWEVGRYVMIISFIESNEGLC